MQNPKLRTRETLTKVSNWVYGYDKQYLQQADRSLYAQMSVYAVLICFIIGALVLSIPFT